MEMGSKEPDTQLDNVLKSIAVNECCTLVYTVSIVIFPLIGICTNLLYNL